MRSSSTFGVALVAFAAVCSVASAHMEMVNPPPRDSKYIPAPLNAGLNIDYTNTAPLGGPRPFPCGHNKGQNVATLKAGTSLNVQIAGGAPHDGGHCQFALSYDNGVTWVVLKTVVRECLRAEGLSYSVPIPSNAPGSNSAIFAWTWINAVGNREYYMNCADVSVDGPSNGSIEGPQLLVVNIPPSSVVIPEFPGQNTAARDGRNYLDSRPLITVTANSATIRGVYTGQGGAAPPSSPAPAPSPPPGTSNQGAPTPAPAPAPSSSGACTEGDLLCQTSVSARSFRQCTQGSWVTQNCPLNTACVQSVSNMVECKLASGVTNQATSRSPPSASPPASSPPSSSSSSGGACTVGAYECLVGAQFRQCDGTATWVNKSCMSGLVCRQYGTDIVCDWP